jgi:hypothetical protein
MRNSMIVGVVLALAGCCGSDEPACTQSQNDALAGILLGGTAVMNGYNQARPPPPVFTTCTKYGCISQ